MPSRANNCEIVGRSQPETHHHAVGIIAQTLLIGRAGGGGLALATFGAGAGFARHWLARWTGALAAGGFGFSPIPAAISGTRYCGVLGASE